MEAIRKILSLRRTRNEGDAKLNMFPFSVAEDNSGSRTAEEHLFEVREGQVRDGRWQFEYAA